MASIHSAPLPGGDEGVKAGKKAGRPEGRKEGREKGRVKWREEGNLEFKMILVSTLY